MIAPSTLFVRIAGAATPTDGRVDIRCNLARQDFANRKRCPAGQSSLIDAIRSAAGLSVAESRATRSSFVSPIGEESELDRTYTLPILTQDRGGFSSSLSLSHGDLSEPEYVTKNGEIKIQLSLSDFVGSDIPDTPYKVDLKAKVEASIDLDIDLVKSATASGKLYNASADTVYQGGSVIPVSAGFGLFLDKVVGSISVSYAVSGALQTATIPPREDEQAGNYDSSLWIVSTCGQVSHFKIEAPECYQLSLPKDEYEFLFPPDYATPKSLVHKWYVCGPKYAANSETEEFYKDAPGTGKIAFRGVRVPDPVKHECYDGGDYD